MTTLPKIDYSDPLLVQYPKWVIDAAMEQIYVNRRKDVDAHSPQVRTLIDIILKHANPMDKEHDRDVRAQLLVRMCAEFCSDCKAHNPVYLNHSGYYHKIGILDGTPTRCSANAVRRVARDLGVK